MNSLTDIEDILNNRKYNITKKTCPQKGIEKETNTRKNEYRLKDVIQNGLCMGCGLCVSIANDNDNEVKSIKHKFLEMKVVSPGRYRPVFLQHEFDKRTGFSHPIIPNEKLILKVCPGINVDMFNEMDKRKEIFQNSAHINEKEQKNNDYDPKKHSSVDGYVNDSDAFMGPMLSVRKCFASDPDVRFRSAAGGGLTALSDYLITTNKIDFVHHIRADKPLNPMLSVIQKSMTRDEIFQGSQSRYGPAAPLENILETLKEKKRFCFVGKPCDINGLSNLAKYNSDVDKYCLYKLTISCGMLPDLSMYEEWLLENRMKKEELVEFRYRGCGCPGASPYAKTESVAQTANDSKVDNENEKKSVKEAECDYRDFFYNRKWSCQLRCKICPDFLGEQSDITVMDCWNKGIPNGEGPGFVLIVGRTAKGESLIQECLKEKKYLTEVRVSNEKFWDKLEKDNFPIDPSLSNDDKINVVSYKDIIRTQPHQMTRKIANYSRQMAVKKSHVILKEGLIDDRGGKDDIEHDERFLPKAIVNDSSLSIMRSQAIKNFHLIEKMKPGTLTFKDNDQISNVNCGEEDENKAKQEKDLLGDCSSKFNDNLKDVPNFLREYMIQNFEGAYERINKEKILNELHTF